MTLVRTRQSTNQALVFGLMVSLVALAWATSLWLPATPTGNLLQHGQGHDGLDQSFAATGFVALGLFLAAWTTMSAAMMLPTALPMVATYATLVRAQPRPTHRVWLFVLGYLTAWAGFGLVAYAVDVSVIHRAARESPFVAAHIGFIGGGVLILAGLYQLTPLKRRCLRQCRSAFSFLMSAWRDGMRGAWLMGIHHGIFCVGCCWALMLLMFGLGMTHAVWMLGLAAFMFAEKVVRGGERLGLLAAPVLIAWGVLTIVTEGGYA